MCQTRTAFAQIWSEGPESESQEGGEGQGHTRNNNASVRMNTMALKGVNSQRYNANNWLTAVIAESGL